MTAPVRTGTAGECPGLFYIDDEPADGVRASMQRAAARRDVPFWPLNSAQARWSAVTPLPTGSLLYARSTSERALLLETWLWSPGVASIYRRGLGRAQTAAVPAFAFAGVATPRTLPVLSTSRAEIDAAVATVGGLPCVLRFAGFSGGRGVVRVDSTLGLYSAIDHALARGAYPELVEFVAGTPWRVAVVDGRAVGCTRGQVESGDFRSRESSDPADYVAPVPPQLAEPATAAARATDVLAAGVDLIERADGAVVVLESNTPFYFGHLERHGIDVAGPIVDALLTRADALRSQSAAD